MTNSAKTRKILHLIFLLAILAFLIYGLIFAKHKVYDKSPKTEDDLKYFTIMSQHDLLEEMSYEGITIDQNKNLVFKKREGCTT
jgi:hypothetical protein